MDDLDREPGTLETDHVSVRTLTPADLEWVVRIDQRHSGRSRAAYYEVKMREAESDTGVRISLAAEIDGEPVGFLMGRLYYGEFGLPEPVATLDSIGVDPDAKGKLVGKALMRQLVMNLRALGIDTIQTQVEWDQTELIGFFRNQGFVPAPRLCLEARIAGR